MIKTFAVLKFGEADSQGDIFMPGSVDTSKQVLVTRDYDSFDPITKTIEIKEINGELLVTADLPDNCKGLYPGIGFSLIESAKEGEITKHAKINLFQIGLAANNVDEKIQPI